MTEQIEKAAEAAYKALRGNVPWAEMEPTWREDWRNVARTVAAILAPAPVGGGVIERMLAAYRKEANGPLPSFLDGMTAAYHAAVDPLIARHQSRLLELHQGWSDKWEALKVQHEKEMKLAHLSNGNLVQQLAALKVQHEQEYKRCPVCDSLDMISSGPTKYICRHCHDTSVIKKLEAELSTQKDRLAGPVTNEELLTFNKRQKDRFPGYALVKFMEDRRASVSAPKQPTLEELAEIVRYAKARNVVLPPASALLAIIERRTQP